MQEVQDPPYEDKIYSALKARVQGFNLTPEQFKQKLADAEYQKNIYKALRAKVGGFNVTEEDFYGRLKKKDESTSQDSTEDAFVTPQPFGNGLANPLIPRPQETPPSEYESIGNAIEQVGGPVGKAVYDFGRSLYSTLVDQTPKAISQSGEVVNAYMAPSTIEEFISKDKQVDFQRYVRQRDPDFESPADMFKAFDQSKYIDKYGEQFMMDKGYGDQLKKMKERLPETIDRRLGKLEYAKKQDREAAEKLGGTVGRVEDIRSVKDALSFLGTVTGQAAGQIPLSAATRGMSSLAMESAAGYEQQLQELAAKHGITEQEVIERNLDRPALNQSYLALAAGLDAVSAGKVLSYFRSSAANKSLGKGLINVVNEMFTEGAQGNLERYAAKNAAGSEFDPLDEENVMATVNEVIAGGLGAGPFSFAIRDSRNAKPITSNIINETQETVINNEQQGEPVGSGISGPDTATDVQTEGSQEQTTVPESTTEEKTAEQVVRLNPIYKKSLQSVYDLFEKHKDDPVLDQYLNQAKGNVSKMDDRAYARIADKFFSELPEDVQEFFATRAEALDFEDPDRQHHKGMWDGVIHGSHITTLRDTIEANDFDYYQNASPEQIASDKLNDLVSSGDISRDGGKVTIITEKGGQEAKRIYDELQRARQSVSSQTEQSADNTSGEKSVVAETPAEESTGSGVSQEASERSDLGVQQPQEFTKREQSEDVNVGFVQPSGMANFKMPTDLIGKLGKKASKWIKKNLTSSGLLPKSAFDIATKTEHEKSANLTKTKFFIADLEKAVKKDFPKSGKKERALINDVLVGNQPYSVLPAETAKATKQFRDHIHQLQKEMIAEGVAEGPLAARMDDEGNTYLNRSYRVHDDPQGWTEYLEQNPEGQAIKNQAVAHIRSQMPTATQDEIDGVINELLYNPEAPLAILKGGRLGSKDLGVLKKRKDIDPVIRALMGEYSDPVVNYAKSVAKMNNLLAHHKLQKQMRADGLGKYFFEKPTKTHFAEIAPGSSKTMDGLTEGKSIYTTPEIKEAIDEWNQHDQNPAWVQKLIMLNGMASYAKTVLSTSTHARNVIGSAIIGLANGHVFDGAGRITNAAKTVWANLTKDGDAAMRQKLDEYVKMGIVGESHQAGYLNELIEDINKSADAEQYLVERANTLKGKTLKKVNEIYAAEDDLFKIAAYENEVERYTKAYADDLASGKKTTDDIKKMSADVVRNTFPTYSLAPRFVRDLRRFPFISSFPTFPAEMIRTSYNTVGQIKKDLSDPRTRSIGVKRLSGLLTVMAASYGAKLLAMQATGVDDEEDEALESFVAPWAKGGQRIYTNKSDNGSFGYVDLSYSDPYSYFKRPVDLLLSGALEDDEKLSQSAAAAGYELAKPFVDEGMLTKRVREAISNHTDDGRQVYNPEDEPGEKATQVISHISGGVEPGTIRSLKRIEKALSDETSQQGKELKVSDELMFMLLGQRKESLSVPQSFGYKMREIKQRLENAENLYDNIKFRKGGKTDEEVIAARQKSKESTRKILEEARKIYQDAIKLGISQGELFRSLEDRRIDNHYHPFIMGYSDYVPERY